MKGLTLTQREQSYRRQKRVLDDKLQSLVVPDADVAAEAGKLLEHLPELWGQADLAERRRILLTMPDAVYVDTVDERRIVAIRPRPAIRPLLEIATMRAGSGILLVHDRVGTLRNQISLRPRGKRLTFRVLGGYGGGSKHTVNTELRFCWPPRIWGQL